MEKTESKEQGTKVAATQNPAEVAPIQDKRTRIEILEAGVWDVFTMASSLVDEMKQVKEVVNGLATEIETLRTAQGAEGNGKTVDAKDVVAALIARLGKAQTPDPKVSKPRFGGHSGAKKVTDTKTHITYDSLSKCAKAVAVEFGKDPNDHFAWYEIYKTAPEGRFTILG